MITSGDTEFEPPNSKIYQLTSSIAMLIAGDTAAQMEIRNHSLSDIGVRLARDQSWMPVAEAADIVSRNAVAFQRRRAERTVLAQYGLTLESFIARQNEMSIAWIRDINDQIARARPNVFTIVAGVDEAGAHIFDVDGSGSVACRDAAGFSAIGWGRRHAESQFMFRKHGPTKAFPETFLLTYDAKKRAEVAPGVGSFTDMFVVIGLGGYNVLNDAGQARVNEIYEDLRRAESAAVTQANDAIDQYFADMLRRIQAAVTQNTQQEQDAIAVQPEATPAEGTGNT